MPEILETFGSHVTRLERIEKQYGDAGIIFSADIRVPKLFDGDDDSIVKTPIGWPLYRHNMFYIVSVPAGTRVTQHTHDEDLFRLVIHGSLVVNDREVNVGEWFVVKKGTPYKIDTSRGYQTLAGYT